MRKLSYLLFVLLLFSCKGVKKSDGLHISGRIKGVKSSEVILQQRVAGEWVSLDTAKVDSVNGSFELNAKVEVPDMVYLSFEKDDQDLQFFAENANITITGKIDSLDNAVIKGSKTQDEYKIYRDQTLVFNAKDLELSKRYKAAVESKNEAEKKAVEEEYDRLDSQLAEIAKKFIVENPKSFVSPYLTYRSLALLAQMGPEELEKYMGGLDSSVYSSPYMKIMKEYVETMKRVAIGQPAPDFTMNDSLGNPVKLSSLFGKYLLVDFWASWCGPCRHENPNVVAVYKDYHKKGFNILGVSFDKDRSKWIKAVKDDKLGWTHVSDLQYWNNAAGKLYGIRSIPSNVLLDPKGIIIARNLRGDDLRAKLKEFLK